jgi:hypothetical protein
MALSIKIDERARQYLKNHEGEYKDPAIVVHEYVYRG